MRPGQQKNRMRGRNRKGPNPLSRSYESNGPDVKIRGNAQHIAEKYMTLARDASASGDRVIAENYLQHAEHYNRIVAAAQPQFQPRDDRDNMDDDDEDGAQDLSPSYQNNRNDQNSRNDQNNRGDRNNRNDRHDRGDRRNNRNDRFQPNGSGPQPVIADDDAPRTEMRANGARHGSGETDAPRSGESDASASSQAAPSAEQRTSDPDGDGDQRPRRRGRPRRDRSGDDRPASETVRAEEAQPSTTAAEASASGEASTNAVDGGDQEAKAPRKRQAKTAEATDGEAPVKRRPGRPRKKKPEDEASTGEGGQGDLPDFLMASNG